MRYSSHTPHELRLHEEFIITEAPLRSELHVRSLRTAAQGARAQHYAPYSKFQVLVAIETTDGLLYCGSNVESVTLTLTVHAETAAILAALADGARERCGQQFIRTVYVACAGAERFGPCGACRQVIREFAADDCVIIGEDPATGKIAQDRLADLLPKSFTPTDIE